MRWAWGVLLAAVAVTPAQAQDGVDLRGTAPVARLLGDGSEVRALGDVNGDGLADLALGLDEERAAGRRCEPVEGGVEPEDARAWQSVAHVVLGRRGQRAFALEGVVRLACPASPVLEDTGAPGSGVSYGSGVGGTVGAPGDWDGDGLADVAVGAIAASPSGRPGAGSVFIAFGARDLADRDLRAAASVVRIDGPQRASELGRTIVPAGDVDGDGRPDLALPHRVGVAAPNGRRLNRERSRVAVVFGGVPAGTRVDLAAPGARALVLTGFPRGRFEVPELAVAPAGDVDGDGRGDLLIASTGHDREGRGSAIVVRGRPGPGLVDVSREPPLLRITGAPGESLGASAALLGDVTGDGRPELAVGGAEPPGTVSLPSPRGSVVVVPPRTGRIDLQRPPADVRRIVGPRDTSGFGRAVHAAGDLTGDGRPDLLVGAPRATPACRFGAGAVYVVPGGGRGEVERLPGVWRIDGPRPLAQLGSDPQVADLGGDGVPDVLASGLPFGNAASQDLYAVSAGARRVRLAPLRSDDCLQARLVAPGLRALRRTGRVVLRIRSDMGAGVRHEVRLGVAAIPSLPRPTTALRNRVYRALFPIEEGGRAVRFDGPGTREIAVRLPLAQRRRLARARGAYLALTAQQTLTRPRSGPEGSGAYDQQLARLGTAPALGG